METTNFENPLEELNSLRQKVDIAETTEQIREIHQRISQVIDENPRLPLSEIAEGLGVKVEKERKGVRLQIYATLKNIRPDIFETENLPKEIQAIEDKFGEKGVYFKKLDIVITPPDKDSRKITQGSGNGIEDKRIYDRVDLATEVLISMGIDLFKCPPFSYGKITDNMMRNTTYVQIQVPQLNKMIHICDEEGNRTFVIYTCENEEEYIEMAKDKLKDDPLVRNFIWTDNVDEWKMRLLALLQDPIQADNEDKEEPTPDKPLETQKMDREYFENPENVRADLEAFAQELGEEQTPLDLRANCKSPPEIKCANGEKKVNSVKYLLRAGVALGFGKNQTESQKKIRKTLETLLKISGFQTMNTEYFNNSENVRADLKAFARELEQNGKKKTPLDLAVSKRQKLEIKCSNGERINKRKYILRAGVALKFARTQQEAEPKEMEIFGKLLQIAGFQIIEYPPMNKEYFTNPENVRSDLEAFAKQLGEDKIPLELSMDNMPQKVISCANGEESSGNKYLLRAGIALDLGKTQREIEEKPEILKKLLQIAGFKPMDKEYFANPENVLADLEAFTQEFEKKRGKKQIPLDLRASYIIGLYIICTNGQKVSGQIYLNTAGVSLKKGRNKVEASKKQPEILKTLLRIAGFEIIEYPSMNEEYFTNPKNVRADLEAFAHQLGDDKTPLDLRTSTKSMMLEITCTNGEKVPGWKYINKAKTTLGLAKMKETLKALLKIAGFEIIEYPPMNEEYFTNPKNVRTDLEAFAQEFGKQQGKEKTPLDLNLNNNPMLEIKCANGEEKVSKLLYLLRAGVALKFGKTQAKARPKLQKILKTLKQIAGY